MCLFVVTHPLNIGIISSEEEYTRTFVETNVVVAKEFKGYPQKQAKRTLKVKKLLESYSNPKVILSKLQRICFDNNQKTFKLQDWFWNYMDGKLTVEQLKAKIAQIL